MKSINFNEEKIDGIKFDKIVPGQEYGFFTNEIVGLKFDSKIKENTGVKSWSTIVYIFGLDIIKG
jgi:hypothetical protein